MADTKSFPARLRGFFAGLVRANALSSPRLKAELENRNR